MLFGNNKSARCEDVRLFYHFQQRFRQMFLVRRVQEDQIKEVRGRNFSAQKGELTRCIQPQI